MASYFPWWLCTIYLELQQLWNNNEHARIKIYKLKWDQTIGVRSYQPGGKAYCSKSVWFQVLKEKKKKNCT